MKIIKRLFLAAVAAFMALWLLSVIICEINTNKLKNELPTLTDIYGEHNYKKVKVYKEVKGEIRTFSDGIKLCYHFTNTNGNKVYCAEDLNV